MLVRDDFEDGSEAVRSPGNVIGSSSTSGASRQGIDAEKTLSIDDGALRISPLITPGWGRSGIAYGPFERRSGLALSVFMLNGHSASEGNSIEESLKGRFFRWVRGSETHSIPHRLRKWAISSHHQHRVWHFYRWLRNHKRRFKKDPHIKENLAVGWFGCAKLNDPKEGNAIVIRTAGAENGELCTTIENQLASSVVGIQNLQTDYVVVLRERGAAYYAASLPNAYGLGAYPKLRLLGIDTRCSQEKVYAGVHQAALGQVGFRVDSRVYGVRADVVPALSNWYGTAHAADRLVGDGPLEALTAETGDGWQILKGGFQRTALGAVGTETVNVALMQTKEPVGALHVVIEVSEVVSERAVLWRSHDAQNTWALFFSASNCLLKKCEQGEWETIAESEINVLKSKREQTVQILDTGDSFRIFLSGKLLFDCQDSTFRNETGVGLLCVGKQSCCFRDIEVHPREIPIPEPLRIDQPWQKQGSKIVISRQFEGAEGTPLAQTEWEKAIGKGEMLLTGSAATRVKADAHHHNPGRLAYSLPWPHPNFADVAVTIRSPGAKRHEGHKGRGGLLFWQDADNYMIVNHWLDDTFDGSAMSAFLMIAGYEEIYDGVWVNLGDRIAWGKHVRHRIVFDGLNFVVYVEEEPVLYRSIRDVYPNVPPLAINRIGIVANWEWGNDTGSEFSDFVALY